MTANVVAIPRTTPANTQPQLRFPPESNISQVCKSPAKWQDETPTGAGLFAVMKLRAVDSSERNSTRNQAVATGTRIFNKVKATGLAGDR